MAVQIGNLAPDFDAETTEGRLSFYKWLGKSWGVLFSPPKDFTPVCTTELGYMARLKPEFDKRNTKIIGLSVNPVEDHRRWAERTSRRRRGSALNFPLIADTDLTDLQGVGHAAGVDRRVGGQGEPRRTTKRSATSSSSAPTSESS